MGEVVVRIRLFLLLVRQLQRERERNKRESEMKLNKGDTGNHCVRVSAAESVSVHSCIFRRTRGRHVHIRGSLREHNSDKEDSISSVIHPRLLPLCQDKREGGTRCEGGEVGGGIAATRNNEKKRNRLGFFSQGKRKIAP